MSFDATLIKNFAAGAAIAPYRLLVGGAADRTVVQASAATAPFIGCSNMLGADSGGEADVYLAGYGEVELGGTVARFTPITANADGKAIAASAGNYVAGIPLKSGVAGDVVPYLIQPQQI